MGFLSKITWKQARHQADGTKETLAVEEVVRELGINLADDYNVCWQAIVEQWMDLHPLL